MLKSRRPMRSLPGFTMYEILIVMAMMVFFAGLTAAMSTRALRNGEFDRVRETVRSELVTAQANSIAGTLDSAWGVAVATSSITRYRGASYATRNATFDRLTTFSGSITLSGTSDVAFTRPFGTSTPATIVITDGTSFTTTTVNAVGAVEVQ